MKIFNKILHSYAIYCCKKMVKFFKCYIIPKKSYDTLLKGAIFFGQLCIWQTISSQYFYYRQSKTNVLISSPLILTTNYLGS